MRPRTEEPSKQNIRRGTGRLSAWLDEQQVKRTVRRWHKAQRKDARRAARRDRMGSALQKIPHAGFLGQALYMVGFWTEYAALCAGRGVVKAAAAVLSRAGALLFTIFRPIGIGAVVFLEDLLEPFARLRSGIRHIRELPEQYPEESRKELRAEKFAYFKSGIRRYLPLVWNAFTYVLPAAGLAALALVVQNRLGQTYRLEVRVNGETVGYVESEQVFDSARDDVQSRIRSARAVMEAAGVSTQDAQWDISPTYTLAVSEEVMTESEVADAILRASSDEIGDGTAVYIDGELRYVTTEGDHLRAYLDALKAPYEDAFDAGRRVEFVHDIELVDGVYFLSSIVPYDTVVSSLSAVTPASTYTVPAQGQTGGEAAQAAGLSFAELQTLNPDLEDAEDDLTPGVTLRTSQPGESLLQVKVVERQTYQEAVPFDTVETESDQYDFGDRVVLQEGQDGLQEIVQDVTYIDGAPVEIQIIRINTLQPAVTRQIAVGTRLDSGMIAHTGTGDWYWPVPNYRYVSRWMSAGHKGADIVAPTGTPIIAADSGVVEVAGWHNHPQGYGNYVIIDHGNGWQTLYGHMSSIAVASGQAVEAGEIIGYVGNTGYSFGSHCHFEMYQNGSLVSARQFFPNM